MKMLTKEECEKALENLMKFGGNGILFMLLMVIDDVACFKNLIDEHFDPKHYKFEDLKPNMWVWDEKEKLCLKIFDTKVCFDCKTNKTCEPFYVVTDIGELTFEENRFYPVTKAMQYQEELLSRKEDNNE